MINSKKTELLEKLYENLNHEWLYDTGFISFYDVDKNEVVKGDTDMLFDNNLILLPLADNLVSYNKAINDYASKMGISECHRLHANYLRSIGEYESFLCYLDNEKRKALKKWCRRRGIRV